MSSSLDRLKVLTSRLEEKIAEKKTNSPHSPADETVSKLDEVAEHHEPAEQKPVEKKPVKKKTVKKKPIKEKSTEKKPVEKKPAKEEPAEEEPSEEKSAEEKPAEEKPAEEKSVEEKPVEEKSVEEEPVKEESVEEKQDPVSTTSVSKAELPKTLAVNNNNPEWIREDNIERVQALYEELAIYEKTPDFGTIFSYKAMNLSGIGLKESDFGVLRERKYIQVIAITYEPDASGKKKAKNISQGYFGKAETIDPVLKNKIIEFVLRWRYEKAFQNVAHYKGLLEKLDILK